MYTCNNVEIHNVPEVNVRGHWLRVDPSISASSQLSPSGPMSNNLDVRACYTTTLSATTTDSWVPLAFDSALSKSCSEPSTKMSSRTMRKHTGNTRTLWTTSCSLSNVTPSHSHPLPPIPPRQVPIRNADNLLPLLSVDDSSPRFRPRSPSQYRSSR